MNETVKMEAELDTSGIYREINRIQQVLNQNPASVRVKIDNASLNKMTTTITSKINQAVKIEKIEINTEKVKNSFSSITKGIGENFKNQLGRVLEKNIFSSLKNTPISSGRVKKAEIPLISHRNVPLGSLAVMCTSYV